jgi:hypothetical protein
MTLNAAEQFLMHGLPDVLSLEKSMRAIRGKYNELWEAICKRTFPELDRRSIHATEDDGEVGVGKKSWPSPYGTWVSGFYVGSISFESLCCDDDPPWASIWIKPPKDLHIDLDAARKRVRQKARDVLGQVNEEDKASEISLWYWLPQSRQQLLTALRKNRGQDFADIMVPQLKLFAPLIPVIDALFSRSGRHGK